MRSVATALYDVLRLDFEGGRVIDLFEISSEVALMVVLPLDETTNLICELGVADVAPRLIHGALIAALERWSLLVVPETATLVASLVIQLTANDIQNECIARYLLVGLDFNDVTRLDTTPVTNLKALVALREDELLDRLTVDLFSRLFQFLVVEEV